MIRYLSFVAMSFALFCPPAWAADHIAVRTGAHDGYSRIVFDWPENVSYSVKKDLSANTVTLSFDSTADLDLSDAPVDKLGNVLSISQLSAPGGSLEVTISMGQSSTFRDFKVGDRVVVDVLGGVSAATPVAERKAADKPVAQESKVATVDDGEKETPLPDKTPMQTPIIPPSTKAPLPVDKIMSEADEIEPHVITVSLTEEAGMAVFLRGETLWIVLDKPNISIPPQIAGVHRDKFPSFKRHDVKGGVAFTLDLPQDQSFFVYGEGGGLLWRVILSGKAKKVEPAQPTSTFVRNSGARGGIMVWPINMATAVLDVFDPAVGDTIKVATVEQADQMSGPSRRYVDFTTLYSPVGMAIQPWTDDVTVNIFPEGIKVTRPGGLAISPVRDTSIKEIRENVQNVDVNLSGEKEEGKLRRIFDFDRWMMGGIQSLNQNQHIIMVNMVAKDKAGQVQDLLTLAKMNVANDRGQEALGFLSYAEDLMPGIAEGPEYLALRGAARSLAGKYELGFRDLMHPALKAYGELDYWRAYSLAWLEDWQQAYKILPKDYSVLLGYPRPLLEKIGLKLAEVALRGGNVEMAESILAVLQKDESHLHEWTLAGMKYLKGEAHRQSGEYDQALAIWKPLLDGKDDLYRTKAGLAVTMLELDQGKISLDAATDRLEGLRYLWRGDELEAQINFILGRLYIQQGKYLKGFSILRDAAGMSPNSDIGQEIASYMSQEFYDLLMDDTDLTPIDVATIYEEFIELTPLGDAGNKLIQHLAERLVEADLLDRAATILQHQVEFRLSGEEQGRVATRLAGIYLLDRDPGQAMRALDIAEAVYRKDPNAAEGKEKMREIRLLRARALSRMKRTEEAVALLNSLPPSAEVNSLRADISWRAGLWDDAAEALQDMIADEAFDLEQPLSKKDAELILHRAVALNLAGNRVALADMRNRYGDAMKMTGRARLFEVVTRPRQSALLSDRETISALVDEVDIFKDFLETYKNADSVSN